MDILDIFDTFLHINKKKGIFIKGKISNIKLVKRKTENI